MEPRWNPVINTQPQQAAGGELEAVATYWGVEPWFVVLAMRQATDEDYE